ncbi:MAG: glycosyltransferase family 4 protein [Bacilli bacterium]|nr:glycosyltransferase family 4 protein [Bacilli bacterium]
MKVLIVFNHPAPYKVRLFNALSKEIDLDVIFERKTAKDRPADFYVENKYDFNVMFLKRGEFGIENSNTSELKKYIKDHHKEYDIILMNGYSRWTEMRAIRYMNKNHIPFVLYVNGGVIKKDNFFKRYLKKKFISSAKYYLSPSELASEYLIHYGAKKEDIFLYNYSTILDKDVLDKPLSDEEKKKYRKLYNLPEGKLFVSASQFIERKNVLQLLECFKGLEEQLVLIGEGPQKELYEKYIQENAMKNVQIRDFMKRNDLFELYKGCDAFITLSKEDIYGHTINEAMAKGLVVISSDNVVAASKLIEDGKNGFIVSLDKKESIINCISSISTLSPNKALEVAKKNTLEVMVKDHIEIFKRIKEKK